MTFVQVIRSKAIEDWTLMTRLSYALHLLRTFALRYDWFSELFPFVVVGQGDDFHIGHLQNHSMYTNNTMSFLCI